MRVWALACLLLAGIVSCDEVKNYRGYHVLSAKAETEEQLVVLRQLQRDNHELIFLRDPSTVLSTDLVVPPDQKDEVVMTLENAGLTVSIQSSDLQAQIDQEMRRNLFNKLRYGGSTLKNGLFSLSHQVYYRLEEVNQHMSDFEWAYPYLARRRVMDLTTEQNKNPVFYMELGTETDTNGNYDKPVIFIEGLAHAREWIVTASLLYTIDTMLSGYMAGDAEMMRYLTDFTWVIIPVVNPDGYNYTWTHNRMWRKNMKFISSQCRGVDLNRNFNVDFGNTGVSTNCRDDTYLGPFAFSEAETQNIQRLFLQLKSRIVAFLSVHAYSQLLLYPWGYISSNSPHKVPENLDQLVNVGQEMKAALDSNGMTYTLGTAYGVLGYAASGAAEDWALQEKTGIYAYCFELRPRSYSQGGFIIDPSNIIPTGEELLRSLLVLARSIADDTATGQ